MKYAFFHSPALNPEPAQSELNRFLAQHRIRDVSREFVNHGEHSAWCLCVIYDESQPGTVQSSSGRPARVDYREVLSSEDFDVFSPLQNDVTSWPTPRVSQPTAYSAMSSWPPWYANV